MNKKISKLLKTLLLSLSIVSSVFIIFYTGQSRAITAQDSVCQGAGATSSLDAGSSNAGCADSTSNLNSIIKFALNILSAIVGIIAVIMIIVGGLRYIISSGDATKTGEARNTILYALVGLAIVALAQIIVHFVLNKTVSVTNSANISIERTVEFVKEFMV